MSKKKIIAIILFIFLGLFMFTYASPGRLELAEPKNKVNKKVDKKDKKDNSEDKSESNSGIFYSVALKCRVKFEIGEGSTTSNILEFQVLQGESIESSGYLVPEVIAKDGYAFRGWVVNNDEIVKASDIINTMKITENIIFTASYGIDKNNNGIADEDEEKLKVIFNPGAYGTISVVNTYEVLKGLKFEDNGLTVPIVTPNDGYLFKGWMPLTNIVIDESTIFIAEYSEDKNLNKIPDEEETKLNVKFEIGEGTTSNPLELEILPGMSIESSEYQVPNVIPSEGYTFSGWLVNETEEVKSSEEVSDFLIEEDITFTAIYIQDENTNGIEDTNEEHYKVTFKVGENGTFENDAIEDIVYEDILIDTKVTVPNVIPSEGYTFSGWLVNETEEVKSSEEVSDFLIEEDTTFTALYIQDINNNGIEDEVDDYYTVNFYDYYNEFVSGETVLVGTSATAPQIQENIGEYEFDGWDNDFSNVQNDLEVYPVYIDVVAPTILLSSTNINKNKQAQISVVVTDEGEGVSIVKVLSGNRSLSDFKDSGTILTLEEEKYTYIVTTNGTYTVYAKDNSGNESIQTIDITGLKKTH